MAETVAVTILGTVDFEDKASAKLKEVANQIKAVQSAAETSLSSKMAAGAVTAFAAFNKVLAEAEAHLKALGNVAVNPKINASGMNNILTQAKVLEGALSRINSAGPGAGVYNQLQNATRALAAFERQQYLTPPTTQRMLPYPPLPDPTHPSVLQNAQYAALGKQPVYHPTTGKFIGYESIGGAARPLRPTMGGTWPANPPGSSRLPDINYSPQFDIQRMLADQTARSKLGGHPGTVSTTGPGYFDDPMVRAVRTRANINKFIEGVEYSNIERAKYIKQAQADNKAWAATSDRRAEIMRQQISQTLDRDARQQGAGLGSWRDRELAQMAQGAAGMSYSPWGATVKQPMTQTLARDALQRGAGLGSWRDRELAQMRQGAAGMPFSSHRGIAGPDGSFGQGWYGRNRMSSAAVSGTGGFGGFPGATSMPGWGGIPGGIGGAIGGAAMSTGGAIRQGVNMMGRGMGSAIVYVPAYSAVRGIGNVLSDVVTQRHRGEFTESAVNMYAAGATREEVEASFMTGTDISARYGGLKGIGAGDFASMRAEFMGLSGTKNMAPDQMDKLTENAIVGARLGKMTPQQAQLEMPTVFELLSKHPQFKELMATDPAAGFTKFQNMVRAGEQYSSGWFRDLIASGRYTFQSLLNTGRPIEQEIGMAFSARAMGMKSNTQGRQLRHLTGKNMEDINRIVAMGATRGNVLESRYLPEDPYKLTSKQLKWMSKQKGDFFVRGAKAFTPAYVSKSGVQTHNRRVITTPGLPEFGGVPIEKFTQNLYASDPTKFWELLGESSSRADDIFGEGEARRGVKSLEVLGVMDSMRNPLIRKQVEQVSAQAKAAFHGQGDTVTGADKLLDASTVYQRATANFSKDVAQFSATNSFLSTILSQYAPDSTQKEAQKFLKNEADKKYWKSLSDPKRQGEDSGWFGDEASFVGKYWWNKATKWPDRGNLDKYVADKETERLAIKGNTDPNADGLSSGMEGAMESVVAAGGDPRTQFGPPLGSDIAGKISGLGDSIVGAGGSVVTALAGVAAAIAGFKISGPGMAQDVRVGGSAETPPQGGFTN